MHRSSFAAFTSLLFLLACTQAGAGRPGSGPSVAQPAPLEIATWNIGWLTDRAADINAANPDARYPIHQRTDADFALLRSYAERLDADIVALQEIDTLAAARKVFDPAVYEIVLTDETDYQRPGFAIRKSLRYTRNPDVEALDLIPTEPRSLRRGADITVHLPGGDIRLLSVHLKSGCFTPQHTTEACGQIRTQIPILSAWIDQRQKEGVAFAVLGDFNRRFNDADPLWAALDNGPTPLVLTTRTRTSACWGGEYPEFIDHILLGNGAAQRLQPESFEVIVYEQTDREDKNRLSDHCPVSVRLAP